MRNSSAFFARLPTGGNAGADKDPRWESAQIIPKTGIIGAGQADNLQKITIFCTDTKL